MQLGRKKSNWKYLWTVPLLYAFVAGVEAIMAGSVVGLMYVFFASYLFNCVTLLISNIWQSWGDLHCRPLYHVHLDSLCMGMGERDGLDCLFFQDIRRSMIISPTRIYKQPRLATMLLDK